MRPGRAGVRGGLRMKTNERPDGSPDRVKYRLALNDAVREVVRGRKPVEEALAGLGLPDEDAAGFQQLLVNELNALADFNCARFRLGFKETQDWVDDGRPS
jgi:hypothetical protein